MDNIHKIRHLSLRIEANMLEKFKYICKYEGRSANNQMLIFIRSAITQFEREHGEIKFRECSLNNNM